MTKKKAPPKSTQVRSPVALPAKMRKGAGAHKTPKKSELAVDDDDPEDGLEEHEVTRYERELAEYQEERERERAEEMTMPIKGRLETAAAQSEIWITWERRDQEKTLQAAEQVLEDLAKQGLVPQSIYYQRGAPPSYKAYFAGNLDVSISRDEVHLHYSYVPRETLAAMLKAARDTPPSSRFCGLTMSDRFKSKFTAPPYPNLHGNYTADFMAPIFRSAVKMVPRGRWSYRSPKGSIYDAIRHLSLYTSGLEAAIFCNGKFVWKSTDGLGWNL